MPAVRRRGLPALLLSAAMAAGFALPPSARAVELRLLANTAQASEPGPYGEFIRQLQIMQALQPLADTRPAAPPSASPPHGGADLSGVRTRGLPPRNAPPATTSPASLVEVAVGPQAARAALDQPSGDGPLLLALLSRLDYHGLQSHPALRQPRRPIAVLLREPELGRQAALIRALLPPRPRIGVVASADVEPLVEELRASDGQDLIVQYVSDAAALADALRKVLGEADALLVLSDRLGNDATASLTLLHAAAAARKPAFTTSEAGVRAGALAAAVASPSQLASQAMALSRELARTASPHAPRVETAGAVSVFVNASVAQRLGIPAPDAAALADLLNTPHGRARP